jgi:hypothetical protein
MNDDMGDGRFIRVQKLGDRHRVTVPKEVRNQVSRESPLKGEVVEWYLESESGVGVVSNSRNLEEGNYVHARATTLSNNGSTTVPETLRDEMSRPVYVGQQVAFLAYPEMLEGEKQSVYFLTKSQIFDLVENDGDHESIRETVRQVPAFLPSPR